MLFGMAPFHRPLLQRAYLGCGSSGPTSFYGIPLGRFGISTRWYRKRKPLKPGNTKKNMKKMTKSPIPGMGPQNTKKIQKNHQKKLSFSGHFRVFYVFFLCFRGPTRNGGFCLLFRIFIVSPGLTPFEGFSYSVPPRGDRNGRQRKGMKQKSRPCSGKPSE